MLTLRILLPVVLAWSGLAEPAGATCVAASAPVEVGQCDGPAAFERWRASFRTRALACGYAPGLVASALDGAEWQPRVIELDTTQPEFVRPIWSYLDSAVSDARIADGQAAAARHALVLSVLEGRTGVDRAALVAIWGLESAYGANIGSTRVVDGLATLACDGRRRALFEAELVGVLDILRSGAATSDQLIGGWAGAMGQTQFMPTTYLAHAQDYDGDGRIDVWTNTGDALASAAHYLAEKGWRAGEPWGAEAVLPAGFDFAIHAEAERPLSEWASLGVARADGAPWPAADAGLPARLVLPAGARGAAFLTFPNFRVFLRYNSAQSYALAAGLLADRIAGRSAGVITPWPRDAQLPTTAEVAELQGLLTALGFDPQGVDGRIGPATRRAVRTWQAARGHIPDGFVTTALLAEVRSEVPAEVREAARAASNASGAAPSLAGGGRAR